MEKLRLGIIGMGNMGCLLPFQFLKSGKYGQMRLECQHLATVIRKKEWDIADSFSCRDNKEDFAPHLDLFKRGLELADILNAKHIRKSALPSRSAGAVPQRKPLHPALWQHPGRPFRNRRHPAGGMMRQREAAS